MELVVCPYSDGNCNFWYCTDQYCNSFICKKSWHSIGKSIRTRAKLYSSFGILVCYCNTFALIAKPTIGSCVLQRFGIGVGFSIIYSALLTKTNRISRIFHSASKSAQRLKYISPQSQVVITTSLIGKILTIFKCPYLIFNPFSNTGANHNDLDGSWTTRNSILLPRPKGGDS